MARTSGHGNPRWTREEVILALALYLDCREAIPGPRDPRVIELSNLLRRNPLHEQAARMPTFRNPDGVAFKIQNLRSVATGKGLPNTAEIDEIVWREFGSEKTRVDLIAQQIKDQIETAEPANVPVDDEEFAEGRLVTRAHLSRERNGKLRRHVLKQRRVDGSLSCDCCGVVAPSTSPELDDAIFEVHHLVPLAAAQARTTKVSDTALLCANCHRIVHRLIARTKRWVLPSEVPGLLAPMPEARSSSL